METTAAFDGPPEGFAIGENTERAVGSWKKDPEITRILPQFAL